MWDSRGQEDILSFGVGCHIVLQVYQGTWPRDGEFG